MKISRRQLMAIIREELISAMDEAALCHDPDTGYFDDCEPGNVYSLTRKGAKSAGIDDDYVQRGTIVKKEKRKPPRVKSKFGLNTSRDKSGGRMTIQGDDITPRRMVSRYPKPYGEGKEEKTKWNPDWKSAKDRKRQSSIGKPSNRSYVHGFEEMDKLARGVGLGIGVFEESAFTRKEIEEVMSAAFAQGDVVEASGRGDRERCRALGYLTLAEAQQRILVALDNFARARDGKLNEPPS